jgi:dipeptidyl aminopeptidase/acylaminoacyl peptidase
MGSRVATLIRDKFYAVLSMCVLCGVGWFGSVNITLHAAPKSPRSNRTTDGNAATVRPIPVDATLRERRFSAEEPFTVSPDNQFVAFVSCGLAGGPQAAQSSELMHTRTGMRIYARGCTLEVQDLRSGHRQHVNKAGFAFEPAWSPDGQLLAYYSDEGGNAQVWLWNRQTGKSRAVPKLIARPYDEPIAWQADGHALYARAVPEGFTIERANQNENYVGTDDRHPAEVTSEPIRVLPSRESLEQDDDGSPSVLFRKKTIADIVRVDIPSLSFTRIVRRTPVERFWVAPNGKHLAFLGASYTSERSREFWLSRVALIDTQSDMQIVLADPVTAYGHLSWSPDSKLLAYVTVGVNDPCDLTIYDIELKRQAFTTKGLAHPRFGFSSEFGYQEGWPFWTPDSARLILGTAHEVWTWERASQKLRRVASLPDTDLVAHIGSIARSTAWVSAGGQSVAFLATDPSTKDSQIYRVDVNTGSFEKSYQQPVYWGAELGDVIPFSVDLSANGHTTYTVVQGSEKRPAVYRLDRDLSSATEVLSLDKVDKEYALGKTEAVEWTGLNGETVRGALLLPAGYRPGQRYPLIVTQYPFSPSSHYLHVYGLGAVSPVGDWQFFATRGYAILAPDFPLKSMKIDEIAGQLERAVDRIVELGIADPKRVGIEGYSMGGHTCIAAIEGTDRFAAAVCENAVWVALTAENFIMSDDGFYMTGIGYGLYNLGGSFWQNKQTFFENDLVFNADRIKTPLLIIRGDLDEPPMSGDALYVALQDLKRDVSYVRYANIGHDLNDVPPAIRRDYLTRVEAWFDRYLK